MPLQDTNWMDHEFLDGEENDDIEYDDEDDRPTKKCVECCHRDSCMNYYKGRETYLKKNGEFFECPLEVYEEDFTE